jgi:hypothetical protein
MNSFYLLKLQQFIKYINFNVHNCFLFFKISVLGELARVRDFEADVIRRKGCASPPIGQNLGMAGGRGLSPDRSSATKSHPLTSENRAMLHSQVGCVLDVNPVSDVSQWFPIHSVNGV